MSKGTWNANESVRSHKERLILVHFSGWVELVIKWGKVGARDGLLALESEFKKIDTKEDPFLAHCIQLFWQVTKRKT